MSFYSGLLLLHRSRICAFIGFHLPEWGAMTHLRIQKWEEIGFSRPATVAAISAKVIRSLNVRDWLNIFRMESFPFVALSVCSTGKHGIDLERLDLFC